MKNIFLAFLAVSCTMMLHAQSMQGKKLLTSSLTAANLSFSNQQYQNGVDPLQKSSSLSLGINPEITFGRVNSNNLLFAYGLNLGYSYNSNKPAGLAKGSQTSYSAGPVILLQKFIAITEKIWYSPMARISGSYSQTRFKPDTGNKQSSWTGGAGINPLSLTFNIRPKANLLMIVGNIGANVYSGKSDNDVFNSHSKSTNGSVYATVNYFSFGYQRVL